MSVTSNPLSALFPSMGSSPSSLFTMPGGGRDPNAPPDEPPPQDERKTKPSTGSYAQVTVQGWSSDKWAKLHTAYLTYHQLVWQALLFYVGQTWITWDPYRKIFYPSVPEDEYTPQPRINRFSPAIDAIAVNFNNIPPIEAVARDADGDEQYKRHGIAQVASRLAQEFIVRQGLKSDFKARGTEPTRAAMMFTLAGTFFTSITTTQVSKTTPLGPLVETTVDMDLLHSMEVLPRPGAERIGSRAGTPYLFVARRMTLDEAWNRLGVDVQADLHFLDAYNSTYENALNYYYTGFNALDLQNEDSALIVECYIPPASDNAPGVRDFYDHGLYMVWANERVQYYKDWDFPEFPITKFDYISVPKMFFARSVAFDLCNLQEILQTYEAIIQLHAMTNAVSPWVVDANTLVSEITGRSDKVVKYRSLGPNTLPPKREAPGSLDQGVYAKLAQIKEEFENISGAASVFRGRAEGSITAGTAIAQLRGQAEQMFSGPQTNWTNGWKETVRKAVVFMQHTYSFEQVQRIAGSNNAQAVRDFMEAPDLDAEIEWLTSQHGLPRTQEEEKQELLNLFDRGALDIKQVEVRERIFELFGDTGMMSQFNLDATRARMENKGMKQVTTTPAGVQGMPVPPTFMPEIEDLETHWNIHVEAIKAIEFDSLPQQNKEMLIQHALQTKAAMQQQQMEQAMMAAPPAGPHTGPTPPTTTSHLSSQGKPTGGTKTSGQGIQPVGASKGAPPAPKSPMKP